MFLVINARMRRLWGGLFSSRDRVLDVGCGDHPSYHRFIPGGIVCADKAASAKAHVLSDAHTLPFRDSSFDGLVCVNSLYYYADSRSAIKEFSRVLRKRGKMILVSPFIYPLHDAPEDKYRFTEYGLRELLRKEFVVERIVPVGGVFSVGVVMVHSLRKGIPLLVPGKMRRVVCGLCALVFFIPALFAETFSLLDALDRTGRWPVYYFTVARRK